MVCILKIQDSTLKMYLKKLFKKILLLSVLKIQNISSKRILKIHVFSMLTQLCLNFNCLINFHHTLTGKKVVAAFKYGYIFENKIVKGVDPDL